VTLAERDRVILLCNKIANEQNEGKFLVLVEELLELLKRAPGKIAHDQISGKTDPA